MNMNKNANTNTNNNNSLLRSLTGKCIKLAIGFFATNAAIVGVRTLLVSKKMKNLSSGYNQMHSLAISNQTVYISPNTQNAFISCVSAFTKIEFETQPVNDIVNIDLFNTLSKVTLTVPKGAEIVFTGVVHCEKVRDLRQNDDGERLFRINLNRSGAVSELIIKCKD